MTSVAGAAKAEFNASNNLRTLHAEDHECVQAMLEDLCDWFNRLYSLQLTADSFIAALDDGVLLCRLAASVHSHAKAYFARLHEGQCADKDKDQDQDKEHVCKILIGHNSVKLPPATPTYNQNARSGTFFARDNVCNFIQWCKQFGVPAYFMFETNDIVLRRNVKNVLLCLLVIARIGSAFGVDVPELIRLEQEIDNEEASEEAAQQQQQQQQPDAEAETEAERRHADLLKQTQIQKQLLAHDQLHKRQLEEQQLVAKQQREQWLLEQQQQLLAQQLEQESLRRIKLQNQRLVDMRTLDEVIREIISDCACDIQILMRKIAPGKYQFGEDKTMIFVRILRNHVMVRVGGGWDTFECFLWKHDPCRRHRPREELQQRAAQLLQKNREIFYCEDAEHSALSASAPIAASATQPPLSARSRLSQSQQQPPSPRRRVWASSLGVSSADLPDGPLNPNASLGRKLNTVNTNGASGKTNGKLNNGASANGLLNGKATSAVSSADEEAKASVSGSESSDSRSAAGNPNRNGNVKTNGNVYVRSGTTPRRGAAQTGVRTASAASNVRARAVLLSASTPSTPRASTTTTTTTTTARRTEPSTPRQAAYRKAQSSSAVDKLGTSAKTTPATPVTPRASKTPPSHKQQQLGESRSLHITPVPEDDVLPATPLFQPIGRSAPVSASSASPASSADGDGAASARRKGDLHAAALQSHLPVAMATLAQGRRVANANAAQSGGRATLTAAKKSAVARPSQAQPVTPRHSHIPVNVQQASS